MTADATTGTFWSVEVITVDADFDASTVHIARLLDVAAGEEAALRRLDGCVADLHAVQAAKSALKTFTAAELREALDFRSQAVGGKSSS